MASGQFELTGASEVADLLSALPDRLADNMMRGAMRAGAAVYRDGARRRVPTGSPPLPRGEKAGTLRRAITISARRVGDQIISGVRILKAGFYWRFVEYGTAGKANVRGIFTRGTRGHHATKPYPFMRPTFDGDTQAAAGAVVEYCQTHIESAVAGQGIYLQGFDEAA